MKLSKDKYGYVTTTLSNDFGEGKKLFRVHRLVACAFIDNPNKKPFVNHINGVKNDNNVENLEWVTNQENLIHSYRVLNNYHNGVLPRYGSDNYNSKGVKCVNKESGEILIFETLKDCAKHFNVHWSTVWCNIKNKEKKSKKLDKDYLFKYNK